MLLRSASSPILKSRSFRSSPEPDLGMRIHTPRSVSMSSSSSSIKRIPRTLSDVDLQQLHISKTKTLFNNPLTSRDLLVEEEEEGEKEGEGEFSTYNETTQRLSGGLMLDDGCGGGAGGNGGVLGGGGDGDSGKESESMDVYYQEMIKAYPEDALVLANYAKFLKEIRGDFVKAEEYCERAILAKPGDGSVLSLYGDLIWINHKDAPRAKSYFDQAVHSAPDDCHVLASYARFLWDAGEEEEEEDGDDQETCISKPNILPPLTAAY